MKRPPPDPLSSSHILLLPHLPLLLLNAFHVLSAPPTLSSSSLHYPLLVHLPPPRELGTFVFCLLINHATHLRNAGDE
jgi:hypothetical protein